MNQQKDPAAYARTASSCAGLAAGLAARGAAAARRGEWAKAVPFLAAAALALTAAVGFTVKAAQ